MFLCFSERYVEQVNPLLVQAQRKLVARIKQYEGHTPPQPHYKNTKRLTSKQYVTKQVRYTTTVGFFGGHRKFCSFNVSLNIVLKIEWSCLPTRLNYIFHQMKQLNDEVQTYLFHS